MTQQTVVVKARPSALVKWFGAEIAKAAEEGGEAGAARLAHVHKVAVQVQKAGTIFEDDGAEQTAISIEMFSAYAPEPGKSEGLTVNADQKVENGDVANPPDDGAENKVPAAASGQSTPGSTSIDAPAITPSAGASYLSKMADELVKSLDPLDGFLAPGAVEAETVWPLDMNASFETPGAVQTAKAAGAEEPFHWGLDNPAVRGAAAR